MYSNSISCFKQKKYGICNSFNMLIKLEGEKMEKEKKQLSLNAKIIITCFFMVIAPNILIFCSLMGIKGYFEATMGSAFRDKVDPSILRFFIMDTLISVIIIMVICMLVVRKYVYKEIVRPISELNVAMKKIAEGNLDYRMENKYDSEMGEVFNNYEEMRLKLKESTTEMMENEEHNRELVSNISHDLKTPITSIKGYVEGIMDGVADTPEKMDRYIKTIYNKANDMDRLINELTIYSKIDNNRILYNFQRINVSDYFGDCVDEVGLDLESKNIKLNFDNLIPDDTMVIADPEQMKRVINNIIGNSIKYMDKDLTKEQGMIEIRLLDDIDSIRIEIEDNGRGIAARDLGRIFERFYRTDASRNSSRGGSGIGLSIVKKIIEDHGGYIWATSKEGEGTCMHFVLRKYKEVDDDE